LTLAISFAVTYCCFRFDFNFNLDLTLLSIAIIFPLVFTIRGSFRRREKALEHLSEFRSALKTVHYFLMSNDQFSEEDTHEIESILFDINRSTLNHLRNKNHSLKDLDIIIQKVYQFTLDKTTFIPRGSRDKIFKLMKDLHESIENLHAIHIHRTPISLKAYCELFIYIFPFIYAPTIIFNIGANNPPWITYTIVLLTEFILISLYNIQNHLEYPFDNVGMDDINLDNFSIDR